MSSFSVNFADALDKSIFNILGDDYYVSGIAEPLKVVFTREYDADEMGNMLDVSHPRLKVKQEDLKHFNKGSIGTHENVKYSVVQHQPNPDNDRLHNVYLRTFSR